MILSNVSVPLLGMVDTGVVGHLENEVYLGAVAIGGTIFGFLYTGVNFLRMGTTGIAAQRYGAGDNDGLRVSLGQAMIVALLIALAMIAVHVPLGNFALGLIGGEPAVQQSAAEYFSIRIWSAPGTLAKPLSRRRRHSATPWPVSSASGPGSTLALAGSIAMCTISSCPAARASAAWFAKSRA